jgi:linoleoyl-CoA desaturase
VTIAPPAPAAPAVIAPTRSSEAAPIRFRHNPGAAFQNELRQEVEAYFKQTGKKKTADTKMIVKTIVMLTGFFGCWALVYTNLLPFWGIMALMLPLGVITAGVGFNVLHDAIHGSYSNKKWVNALLGKSLNLIGGSDYIWAISHNIVHHTYTNVPHVDIDLKVAKFIRLSTDTERIPIHKHQHRFAFFVYSLTTFFWVLVKDYKKLAEPSIGHVVRKHPAKEIIIMFATKLAYYTYSIVLPILLLDIMWYQWLLCYVTMHMVAGFTLGIVFQMAHVVENTDQPSDNAEGFIEQNWSVHQMATTSNFAPKNKLLGWFVGGLNFQVEHHLFPKICSTHYSAINPIVERVAKKHNVPYNCYPTFGQAIASHYRTLKMLGNGTHPVDLANQRALAV